LEVFTNVVWFLISKETFGPKLLVLVLTDFKLFIYFIMEPSVWFWIW
jgi:hypothetical protein